MKKGIFSIVIASLVVIAILFWLFRPDITLSFSDLMMLSGVILLVGFALFLGIRRIRDAKERLPTEDEFSKKVMRKASSSAYFISLYLWLAIMILTDESDLEIETIIGAGVMGMAVVFAGSWIFHRYIRRINE